jgi:hypothetical protein
MANSIASLFGPSAEEIVYDRNQTEKIRQQAQLSQSLAGQETQAGRDFYRSGYNMTKGISEGLAGLFGYSSQMEDPRIANALKLRQILGDTSVDDLNDETKVSALSSRLGKEGLTPYSLYFADRAKDIKKYNLELATALEPVLLPDIVTKDGRTVGRNKYNQYFTLDDNERVDQGSLQSVRLYEKEVAAGSKEPSGASSLSIEQSFLADTDLDKETKRRAANYLDQEADIILREPRFKGATKEAALAEAYRRALENGVIRKKEPTFIDAITGNAERADFWMRQDWEFSPPSPLAPTVVNEDGTVVRRDFTQVGTP